MERKEEEEKKKRLNRKEHMQTHYPATKSIQDTTEKETRDPYPRKT